MKLSDPRALDGGERVSAGCFLGRMYKNPVNVRVYLPVALHPLTKRPFEGRISALASNVYVGFSGRMFSGGIRL